MKLGVFTVSTPEYDICDTLNMLRELGYGAVEWRVAAPAPAKKPENYTHERRYWSYNHSTLDVDKVDAQAADIGAKCSACGIEVLSLTTYLSPWETEALERVLKAARLMGCKNVRVCSPAYDGSENYRKLFTAAAGQAKVLEGLASSYGVRINFEIHMNTILPSASAAYRLVSGLDPTCVGVIYDPGNMVFEGFENYKLGVELLGEYLTYVHLKNALWKPEAGGSGAKTWKPLWAPLTEGIADIKTLLEVLNGAGYTGYLSIEDFSNEEDTYTKLKGNKEFIEALLSGK